eukprot:Seg659.6 transcript_id=Seg659.6/GoldUCD/mRNA.D3Y31 product="Arf-GAP with coiled-coil ANK repeat and PH domain-containing protein 3" protein_id=Seg659.6/GoldUCD/D3Y31
MRDIPSFEFILEDSPEFHQSMKYWNQRSKDVRKSVSNVATNLEKYHATGINHKISGDGLCDALSDASRAFKGDETVEEPLNKFSDAITRIECYREMLLNQTSMLGVQPLMEISRYIKKAKELKHQVSKANENLHIAWDKFASIPNQKNLQEPAALDKAAHTMLNARENYQMKLAKYVQVLREIHTVKKSVVLQKVLEHMLAQYSFFNFSYQVLKEIEPYMTEVFNSITKQLEGFELQLKDDFKLREEVEKKISDAVKEEKKVFPDGYTSGHSSTMHAINASTGRFFTKFGGMIASGVQGVRGKTMKDGPPPKPQNEENWEVIDDPSKRVHSDSVASKEEQTGFVKSASELTEDPPPEGGRKSSQFYLKIDEESNNVVVQTADQLSESKDKPRDGSDLVQNEEQVEKHLEELNEESVVSLTDLLEAASQDEAIARPRADSVDPHFKKGYLRIKQKGTLRNRFPLLYVVVDKKQGNILAQGDDQTEPNLLTNLTLSTVRECDIEETDRNFCFQVISATKEYTFQAHSADETKKWMQAIQEAVGAALNLSQERIRSIVRSKTQRESKMAKQKKSVIGDAAARIRAVDGNKQCSDCSAPRPDWASVNIGVIFCIECSGMHRGLGVHISKVRSLTLDRWDEDTHMEERGNAKMNKILEGRIGTETKPTRNSSKEERRKFIIEKYVNERFAIPSESDEVDLGGEDITLDSGSSTEDDLFRETDQQKDLFGTSIHSAVVCLVKGCQECAKEKSKPEHSNEGIKDVFSTSKLSVSQTEERDSEAESTKSSNDLKEKESNF